MAMTAMTTSNSISVKARLPWRFGTVFRLHPQGALSMIITFSSGGPELKENAPFVAPPVDAAVMRENCFSLALICFSRLPNFTRHGPIVKPKPADNHRHEQKAYRYARHRPLSREP
jgi:hypothetical protein